MHVISLLCTAKDQKHTHKHVLPQKPSRDASKGFARTHPVSPSVVVQEVGFT
jgi:hypothetical protein